MKLRGMNTRPCPYKRKADKCNESNTDGSNLAKNQKTSTQRIMYRWGELNDKELRSIIGSIYEKIAH